MGLGAAMPTEFDPITLEVVWTRLISVIDEAALTLHRTSFSTVVRESHDYSCMVLSPDGQSTAQATRSIPSFIGTLPISVRAFTRKFPLDSLRPGDVLVSNDPWIGTGHLPDLTIAAPIFSRDVVIGFAGAIAHMADIGGRRRAPDNKDIYEEGLQIPVLKLFDAGAPNETLFDIIRKNVRVPDEVTGDIHAMVGACAHMGAGVLRLMDEYSLRGLSGLTRELTDLTEGAMRRAISNVPDGTFEATTRIDSFDSRTPLEMHCRIDVKGDQLAVDFAGSSPQNRSPLNSVMSYTRAYSTYALKCVLSPDIPNNDGSFRPITVSAPEGCFLNPAYPAAVEARATVGHYCTSAVFNTLALVLPDQTPAESGIPLHGFAMSGWQGDQPFSTIVFYNGGLGARPDGDGLPTLSFPTNVSCTPTEVLERSAPVRILEKALLPGSGGAGQFRGGLGQRIAMEVTSARPVTLAVLSQRLNFPPRGRQGGENGSVERILLNGEPVEGGTPFQLNRGDVIVLELPGGGGFGNIDERSASLQAADRKSGLA